MNDVIPIETLDRDANRRLPLNPAWRLLELERNKLEIERQVAEIQQTQLLMIHQSDPGVQAAFEAIQQSRNASGKQEALIIPVEAFLSARQPETLPDARASNLADRSTWSPKLRKLIEVKFPEATKAERVRRALEASSIVIGEGLTMDEIRYFAEDKDLEYEY